MQRPLKFATHLPELGIDARSRPTTRNGCTATTSCSRRRRRGSTARATSARKGAARPRSFTTTGADRLRIKAGLFGRRLLVPDENVGWMLTAIPAATRIVRREGIDVVLTTSPPGSVHFVGAAVQRLTGVRWVADLRDSNLPARTPIVVPIRLR